MVLLLFILGEDLNKNLFERTTTIPRGGYPDESDSDPHNNRRTHDG